MTRFISLRTSSLLLVAVACLVASEGLCQARTPGQALRTEAEVAQASSGARAAAAVAVQPMGGELARVRVCHISRHPRDGVPATEHACPLVIADATGVVAPAATASLPN